MNAYEVSIDQSVSDALACVKAGNAHRAASLFAEAAVACAYLADSYAESVASPATAGLAGPEARYLALRSALAVLRAG